MKPKFMKPEMRRRTTTLSGALTYLFLLAATGRAQPLAPFTTDRDTAMSEAQQHGKLVLLIASRSDCTSCQLVKDYSLQTTNPPCRQMVEEAFVYWTCASDLGCSNYLPYVPDMPDTFLPPLICRVDPSTPATQTNYLGRMFGPYDGTALLSFFRRVALTAEMPQVTNLLNQGTINTQSFTVRGTMQWTNVPVV